MRKTIKRMLVVAGVVALLLPTVARAEWDQTEKRNNQDDHDELVNVLTSGVVSGDFDYGMESPIGYDRFGNGTATLLTNRVNNAWGGAPWNTTPCPIQLADGDGDPTWDDSMGNCPVQNDPDSGQTDAGWDAEAELYGVILDDLYSRMDETASITTPGNTAFKKVSQVLDILFYRSNTVGEVFGMDGWKSAGGDPLQDTTWWYGAMGIDQTLDQDVADIEGTATNPGMANMWDYDHVAQTFYQDFRLWDKGNTFGPLNTNANSGTSASLLGQNYSPRMRHGMELLALCSGGGKCTNYDIESNGDEDLLYTIDLDVADFAFFDQWVIQSMKDTYDYGDLIAENGTENDPDAGFDTTASGVSFVQSYSSWMVQGAPGDLCESINDLTRTSLVNPCSYTYEKNAHEVDKSIANNGSKHQTGDP